MENVNHYFSGDEFGIDSRPCSSTSYLLRDGQVSKDCFSRPRAVDVCALSKRTERALHHQDLRRGKDANTVVLSEVSLS